MGRAAAGVEYLLLFTGVQRAISEAGTSHAIEEVRLRGHQPKPIHQNARGTTHASAAERRGIAFRLTASG